MIGSLLTNDQGSRSRQLPGLHVHPEMTPQRGVCRAELFLYSAQKLLELSHGGES